MVSGSRKAKNSTEKPHVVRNEIHASTANFCWSRDQSWRSSLSSVLVTGVLRQVVDVGSEDTRPVRAKQRFVRRHDAVSAGNDTVPNVGF